MSPLGLLWVILTLDVLVTIGHAVPLQESSSEVSLGRFRRQRPPYRPRPGSGFTTRPPPPENCEDNGDVRQNFVTLYHYTTRDGYNGIQNSGYIRGARSYQPRGDDSRYGRGVYFTAMGPERSDANLAWNNWNGPASRHEDKLEYYFECRIPRNEVCHSRLAAAERKDIWVVPGDRLDLREGNCRGGQRRTTG